MSFKDDSLEVLVGRLRRELATNHGHLAVMPGDNHVVVTGGHSVVGEDGKELTRFSIRIELVQEFPGELPVVFETGNRIPRIPDRHVNKNGSCCLGVPSAIRRRLGRSFSLGAFIDGPLNDYFLFQSLTERGLPWSGREARHGELGVADSWSRIFPADSPLQMARVLIAATKPLLPKKNGRCPCGRRRRARRCHRPAIIRLRQAHPATELSVEASYLVTASKNNMSS